MRGWPLLALLALLLCSLPARAQQLTLNTEVDYLFEDQRLRNPDQHTTTSGLLPRLDLSLTGPVRPGARLYLDLTGGLSRNSFGLGQESTDDTHLVLRGEAPHYRISLRHGNSRYTSTTDTLDLGPSQFTTNSKETGLTLILREPSWPVFNVQYSRYTSDTDLSGATSRTDSTDSRLAGLYDLTPLHFRLDTDHQTARSAGSASSESNTRRFGISLDTALFPKLDLYGDLELSHNDTRTGDTAPSGTDGRLGQVRVSTELTPKVAVDAEMHMLQTNSIAPLVGIGSNDLSTRGSSVSMRSEVMPGLQFNISKNVDRSEYGNRVANISSVYGDVLAQLDARNSLAFSFSPSRAAFVGYPTTTQNAYQASWTTHLDSQTDFLASLNKFTSTTPSLGSNSTASKYVSVRYHPDLQTTLGLGLLWNTTNGTGVGAQTTQQERGIDLNLAWLPTSEVTLGFDLSLTRLTGDSQATMKVPSLDLRWQPDSKGALYLSWRLQDATQQQDVDALSRLQSTALSARFERQLSRRSSVSLSYDVLKFNEGPLAYDRRLAISVTTGLGQ